MKLKKYRNKFEKTIGEILWGLCRYEPFRIPYIIHRKYTPDFVGDTKSGIQLLVECKGYFRVGDTQKYKSIRDSLGQSQELVFVLHNPNKRVRKGSQMTMAEWCEKENLLWFTSETICDAFD